MKMTIDIPQEFEKHFDNDRFKDNPERIKADLNDEFVFVGLYERELLEMLIKAFKNAEPVKCGKWIKGKCWDEWFCSVCRNGVNLDWKENPVLSDYCPNCGTQMKEGDL